MKYKLLLLLNLTNRTVVLSNTLPAPDWCEVGQ